MVFYPAYPALIRFTRLPAIVAALLISTIAAFFFAWGLQRLVALDHEERVAKRVLLLYLAFPSGFILFAGYPESLLLACMVWAVYFQRSGNPLASAALALFSGATKAVGAVVFVPLIWIALARRRFSLVIAALLALLPAAAMALLLNSRYHMTMNAVYVRYWGTQVSPPWETLWAVRHSFDALVGLNLMVLMFVVFAALIRRERAEYTAFVFAGALLLLTKQTEPLLQSTMRYVLALFPAFISIARIFSRDRHFYAFAVVLFVGCELQVFAMFLGWRLIV
jgi:hypothetical protein